MDEILKDLFPTKKKGYREIWTELEIHPKEARRRLDDFIKKRIIQEEGREKWKALNYHPGKKILYSLTDEGRKECINMAIGELNETLELINELLIDMTPSKLENWKLVTRATFKEIKTTEDMPLDRRIKWIQKKIQETHGPLIESYKNIHKLICKLCLPSEISDLNHFIGLTEGLGLRFIPAKLVSQFFET